MKKANKVDAPLLSICLITYNHNKYIREAIDSVLMQKVNFTWELIIADDFSTDGTREIVLEYKEKYPDFIELILQEKNVGAAQNWRDLITSPKSKYIAYFEGDDYWTDPYKLQKQVNFLEANPDYGLVHTDYDELIDKTNRTIRSVSKSKNRYIPQGFVYEDLLYKNFIVTCTVCLRKNLLEKYMDYDFLKTIIQGDAYIWSEIAQHSKIGYIDNSTAVHRVLQESASHSLNEEKLYNFALSALRLKEYLFKKYNCSEQVKEKTLERMNRWLLYRAFRLRSKEIATNAFSHLWNNKKIDLVDKLLFCSINNLMLWLLLKTIFQLKALLHIKIEYWN